MRALPILLIAALAWMTVAMSRQAQAEAQFAPQPFLPHAALSIGNRLWVLGTRSADTDPHMLLTDRLVEIDLATGSAQVIFERGVIGIAKAEHRLYVLRNDVATNRYAVEVVDGQTRSLLPTLPYSDGQALIGVAASAGQVVVFSRQETLVFENGAWRRLDRKIAPADRQWAQFHNISGWNMPTDGSALYVAYGSTSPFFFGGGGGLERVDLKTGRVIRVRSFSLTTCGGLISGGCDDVGAPIPDHQRPDCVIAAVNDAENRQGQVVRVCGRSISLVYENSCEEDCGQPQSPIAFTGDLAKGFAFSRGNQVTYVRPRPARPESFQPMTLRQVAGVMVDTSRPDLILVSDGMNPSLTSGLMIVGRE